MNLTIELPDAKASPHKQLAAAKRELSLRRSAYPRWVEARRMTQASAEHEIACMESIVDTLEAINNAVEGTVEWDRALGMK